jgi:hypothetical protein
MSRWRTRRCPAPHPLHAGRIVGDHVAVGVAEASAALRAAGERAGPGVGACGVREAAHGSPRFGDAGERAHGLQLGVALGLTHEDPHAFSWDPGFEQRLHGLPGVGV